MFDANHFGAELHKCCPPSLELVRSIGEPTSYVCRVATIPNDISGHRLRVPPSPLTQTMPPQMPAQCGHDSAELFELSTNVFETAIDAARICVDRTADGRIVGLVCKTSSDVSTGDQPTTTVRRLTKCCAHGSVYDLTERQCITPMAPPSYEASATEVLIFDNVRTTNCESQDDDGNAQVFAEYMRSGWHRLRTSADGSVDVLPQIDAMPAEMASTAAAPLRAAVHLQAGTFCVDDAVQNSTTVAGEGEGGGPIIVRACRSRYECDDGRLTCVRRCCANEQMMERRNGSSVCVPYDRNIRPTFYDVRLPLVMASDDGGDDPTTATTTMTTTPEVVILPGRIVD